jgi:alpha-ribazole phosphatase/probable phosphoglycerate mutase
MSEPHASTRLIFVRHGHTAANGDDAEVRVSGWTDFPLSPLGRRQAEALRLRLEVDPPDIIYASTLQRARATAEILAGLGPGLPVQLLDELREIFCGEAEGRLLREAKQRFAEVWAANLLQEDEGLRLPGGESYREFRERCLGAVRRIAAAHPGERVLIVTHAGVIGQVLGALYGTSPALWADHRPGNCSLTTVDWYGSPKGATGVVLGFDDRSHLEELDELELDEVTGGGGTPWYDLLFAGVFG